MSLFHISDKLNQLSNRRYTHGRKDIPKILNNYNLFIANFELLWTRSSSIMNNYVRKRVETFTNEVPYGYIYRPMPGQHAREQFWVDPRVEFGLQNRRRR